MEKLLFFDIDGTISYPGNSPASAVVEAIRNARANGHKVFLSTGRTRNRVPKAVMDIGFDGGIFSAGGIVMYRDTILSQNFMPEPMVRNILSLLKGKRIFYRLINGRILGCPYGMSDSVVGEKVIQRRLFSFL